jgi:hypothetical protein
MPVTTLAAWEHAQVRTTASGGSEAWKEQIAVQMLAARPLPATGDAELVVAYRVGPRRSWLNLRKPSIDALGSVLGSGSRRWHPRDGRIRRAYRAKSIRIWDGRSRSTTGGDIAVTASLEQPLGSRSQVSEARSGDDPAGARPEWLRHEPV